MGDALSEQYVREREAIGWARHEITKAIGALNAARRGLDPVFGIADTTALTQRLQDLSMDLDHLVRDDPALNT